MDCLMDEWTRWQAKSNPLILWTHPKHGTWLDGLFRMHDQLGFSLTDSLIECRRRGWHPAIEQFKVDAMRAGWSQGKIEQMVAAAIADAASIGPPSSSPPAS